MSRLDNIRKLGEILESLSEDSHYVYILFVDLCNSTEFKQYVLGAGGSDSDWLTRQLIFLQLCARHIKASNGSIIKTLGDGLMATFDYSESAEDILHSCVEMVRVFDNLKTFKRRSKVEVRISLDYGETVNGAIIDRYYDPLGLCVDRCARLNSLAASHEITFSSEFNKQLQMKDKSTVHEMIKRVEHQREVLKGLGSISYYKVVLDQLA